MLKLRDGWAWLLRVPSRALQKEMNEKLKDVGRQVKGEFGEATMLFLCCEKDGTMVP